MQRRTLGKTGMEVSILGLGGFHMLEISKELVLRLMDMYLDAGGNYVETAAAYGDGESEKKMAYALKGRRDDVVLASKCHMRDFEGAKKTVEQTLKNLETDRLDILFLHGVTSREDVDILLNRPSALDYVLEAKEKGLIRNIGISFHGLPDYALQILTAQDLDVVMTGFNYYDRFNFPKTYEELLPYARSKNMGVVGMKAVADGYLYRSPEDAFRYSLSQDIDIMVAGTNSEEMLSKDIRIFNDFRPMTEKSIRNLYHRAPELGSYVCRQCDKCLPCPEGIDIPKIFEYEGWYDRQMRDYQPHEAPDYALRERLAFWFGNRKEGEEAYKKLEKNYTNCTDCGICEERCPYDLPVTDKLKLVHFKLGGGEIF